MTTEELLFQKFGKPLLRLSEVSEMMRISPKRLSNYISEGRYKSLRPSEGGRIGVYHISDVAKAIDQERRR